MTHATLNTEQNHPRTILRGRCLTSAKEVFGSYPLCSERKRSSAYRMLDPVKKKIIRHLKEKKNVEEEGTSYEAGGF